MREHGRVEVASESRLGFRVTASFGLDLIPYPELICLRLRRRDCWHCLYVDDTETLSLSRSPGMGIERGRESRREGRAVREIR